MKAEGIKNDPVNDKVYQNSGNPGVIGCIPPSAKRVLDVGCGAGDNGRALAQTGAQVDGLTLSESEAAIARKCLNAVYIHNLESGLPAEVTAGYDAILASHVLEHICFPEKLLADIRRVLTDDGVFVVALPNLLIHRNRLKMLLGEFEYESGGIMDNTHFKWYTFKSAQDLLRSHGFTIVEAFAEGNAPIGPLRKLMPSGLASAIDRAATKAFPGMFGWQMIFVAKKT
ncbi:class I SAM-dependent methyltransferase [Cerasicoccus fimbriatus]|uniref:class I SAM-dependent methyltransferase n=1 Tax=Cerasicoccus fimbriatus TaxID=3014554 RepID=UPI0022B43D5C|nr:class I SAM-dependent methyltransferase [Cerasicoccus sp. TK19100]